MIDEPPPARDLGDESNPDLGVLPGEGTDLLLGDEAVWVALAMARERWLAQQREREQAS